MTAILLIVAMLSLACSITAMRLNARQLRELAQVRADRDRLAARAEYVAGMIARAGARQTVARDSQGRCERVVTSIDATGPETACERPARMARGVN